jgi:hypothetical protein
MVMSHSAWDFSSDKLACDHVSGTLASTVPCCCTDLTESSFKLPFIKRI